MEKSLQGLRIAILVADLFEQVELTEPREILQDAGARTAIVAPASGKIQGMHHDVKADQFDVDVVLDDAAAVDFDGVLLPGGVINADQLRTDERALDFIQRIEEAGKPIAVICHGPWLLVSAGLVDGRTLTSWPSLRDDIRNAGGQWLDREVVVDGNWVSSRKPGDIPAFGAAMVEVFARVSGKASVVPAGAGLPPSATDATGPGSEAPTG